MDRELQFQSQRPRLFALAYRMLGGVSDAEDVVQDAWLRWSRADAEVVTPAAYLRSVVTRLCIDRLRALKSRRETYVGPWLPEPVPEDMLAGTGEEAQLLADSLRVGVLLVLERLSPVQRAVFVLRELLDCDYAEIAEALGRSAATCRQIFLRAKARLGEDAPGHGVPRAEAEAVVGEFLGALAARDLPRLTALLTADAIAVADHGGKARAARRTVHGADPVARLLAGLANKSERLGVTFDVRVAPLSGGPGLLVLLGGVVATAATFTIVDGRISAVHIIANPDKLRHLQPAA
jgi:RNA polymerase sigma-70 factor (ECF subfamily)